MKMIVKIINKASHKNYFTAKQCVYTHREMDMHFKDKCNGG